MSQAKQLTEIGKLSPRLKSLLSEMATRRKETFVSPRFDMQSAETARTMLLPSKEWEQLGSNLGIAWRSMTPFHGIGRMVEFRGVVGANFGLHCHAHDELFLVVSGEILVNRGGQTRKLGANEVESFPAGQKHAVAVTKEGSALCWWPGLNEDFIDILA